MKKYLESPLEKTDLHLHTYYSDGTQSPEQVLEYVAAQGLKTAAITDHDGIDGVNEGIEAGRKLGIKVISGIEFSAIAEHDIKVHILGYYVNIDDKEMIEEIRDIRRVRRKRNERLLQVLNNMGYELKVSDLIMRKGQDYIGKPIFARALVAKGYIDDPKAAFSDVLLNNSRIKALKKKKLPAEKAIKLIHGAGGKAVLAHPGKIKRIEKFYRGHEELIRTLIPYGLDGLECYHKDHTSEDEIKFTEIAEKLGLFITKGSDYHGPEFE